MSPGERRAWSAQFSFRHYRPGKDTALAVLPVDAAFKPGPPLKLDYSGVAAQMVGDGWAVIARPADPAYRLVPGATYSVSGQAVADDGTTSVPIAASFTTITPDATVKATVYPTDDDVVGVGQPIVLKFSKPINSDAARQSVLSHVTVAASQPVAAGWHWFSNRELHPSHDQENDDEENSPLGRVVDVCLRTDARRHDTRGDRRYRAARIGRHELPRQLGSHR